MAARQKTSNFFQTAEVGLGKRTIAFFLKRGYPVMAFSMPLLGMNNKPVVDLLRLGKVKLEKHAQMSYLDYPIKYFIEPVVVAINYVEDRYSNLTMTGISGGGWTTTLCAAIDPRITASYPVAGSLPTFLKTHIRNDWGCFEGDYSHLYRVANYPELYVMGSSGNGRKQTQMLNQYDICCFGGVGYTLYEDVVSEVTKSFGGTFRVFLDPQGEHRISDEMLMFMLQDMEK